MRTRIFVISIFLVCFLFGCERPADVASPLMYDHHSIRFSYPANWQVTEDVEQPGFRYLFVETPGDAIFIAQIYSEQYALTLDEFAESFSESTKQEVPIGKIEENVFFEAEKETTSGMQIGIKENFNIVLLGEKVPHTREYFSINTIDKRAFLISQAAAEDWIKVEPGFDLIFSSFVVE
ncbi:MAG: hypothetical protein QNJ26_14495 [Desulfobacterales bacterium]|nr:hypothetical protein [Desulfobacterales bacterium]